MGNDKSTGGVKKEIATAGLVFFILTVFFAPLLIFDRISDDGDLVTGFFPIFDFYRSQITQGEQFIWTSNMLLGFPLYLDPSGGFFSPVNIFLFKHFSTLTAYNLALFVATGLVFLFSYLFARNNRISRAGSFITATVFSFGHQNAYWSGNLNVVNAYFVFPMLLFCISQIEKRKYFWILIGGVGLGYSFLGGQPQWIIMACIGAGFYILYKAYLVYKNKSGDYWKLIFGFLVILLLGFVIVYPQILSYKKFTQFSVRSEGLSYAAAQISSQTPLDWVWYLFPGFKFKYLNGQEQNMYVGILPFVLGILAVRFLWRKDNDARFFSILWALGLLIAIKYSPIFWVIHKFPVLEYFRGANRWMYLGNFGLAMLAGRGFDLMRTDLIPKKYYFTIQKTLRRILIFVVATVFIANVVNWVFFESMIKFLQNYFDAHYYAQTTKLPIEHYHNSIRSLVVNQFSNISFHNYVFLISLSFLFAVWILFRRTVHTKGQIGYGSVLSLTLVVTNLLLLHPNYIRTIPRHILEERPEIATLILNKDQPEELRVFTILPGDAIDQKLRTPFAGKFKVADTVVFGRDMLQQNYMMYGLDLLDGSNNIMSRRTGRMITFVGSKGAITGSYDVYTSIPKPDKLDQFLSRLPLLSMMNVKYLISAFELPPTQDLNLIYTISSTRFNIPIYLYENKKVLPRIYLANGVEYVTATDEEENFRTIAHADNDFSKVTFIECQDCQNQKNFPSKNDAISIQEYKNGYLSLSASIEKGRWLIFSESNLPGWKVTIDQTITPSSMANYLFHGIYIPAGEHKIEFSYRTSNLLEK